MSKFQNDMIDAVFSDANAAELAHKGSAKSGNWGHSGRPGKRGGSAPKKKAPGAVGAAARAVDSSTLTPDEKKTYARDLEKLDLETQRIEEERQELEYELAEMEDRIGLAEPDTDDFYDLQNEWDIINDKHGDAQNQIDRLDVAYNKIDEALGSDKRLDTPIDVDALMKVEWGSAIEEGNLWGD